jgi:FKBP-type peptidyl-prolyl cis-trans isomerase FkpA
MKTHSLSTLLLTAALLVPACKGGSGMMGAAVEPKTDDQKTLYALGQVVGNNVSGFNLTPAELEYVKAGLSDSVLGKKSQVDMPSWGPKIRELARQRHSQVSQKDAEAVQKQKELAKPFLEAAAKEQGAVKLPSGLIFRTLKEGSGESPKPTDTVKVHYTGTLQDGTVFDSSVQRGQPATFPLNHVIPCWTEGVGHMKVGEKAKLTCPSEIGYGDRGSPPKIPGGAPLTFEVELFSIEQGPPKPAFSLPMQTSPAKPGAVPLGAVPLGAAPAAPPAKHP